MCSGDLSFQTRILATLGCEIGADEFSLTLCFFSQMLRQVKSIETFDESAGKAFVGPGNEF